MARYHFGYHDWPLTGEDCPVCQERDDRVGEDEAIAAAELKALEDEAKAKAKARGWLIGDINQTDSWFRGA